ncbi:MAG TPA: alanine-zipper protein [Geminicoccaceae bacterium]|nr:alanine-zipper protein [Geminicoccaceae bacterium]
MRARNLCSWKRFSMRKFGRGLRLMAVAAGLAGLAACQTMSDSDRAMIEQARADAQAAQAAADRAAEAADRAAASANEAADAASTAQMAMERQERMVQQTMRK